MCPSWLPHESCNQYFLSNHLVASASTESVEMIPSQCRAARALIDWSQPKLAEASGFSISTIVDFERQRRAVSESAVEAMAQALEAAGVEFIRPGAKGPGVRLRQAL
jgi:ribosome-binding protein aMBF1 (putative translation factor)